MRRKRLTLVVIPLALAFAAVPFAACGTSGSSSAGDAGDDSYVPISDDGSDEFAADIPFLQEAATVTHCKLQGDADPVGLCVQQAALASLHAHAFVATKGVTASWSSTTGSPDPNDAGVVAYTLDDTVAYAAAAVEYLASAEQYGDTTLTGPLESDLQSIATQIEENPVFPGTEYSGDLYLNLRTFADGLRALDDSQDGAKIDTIANAYGRSILTAHYFVLTSIPSPPDAGAVDATADSATLLNEAGSSEGGLPVADGIFGNASGSNQVAYAPGDVATAAYALLDLVNRNPTDSSVPSWLHAVRASLNHLVAAAHEPTTGMLYTSLLANRSNPVGTADVIAPSTNALYPSDALLADTQATFVLALTRAQNFVTANTTATLDGVDGSGPIVDGGVTGPFLSILDLPFEGMADAVIDGMNGTHSLWDGAVDAGGSGFVDAYLPSTGTRITTKSTRANALMAEAAQFATLNNDLTLNDQHSELVQLLLAQELLGVASHTSLISVLPNQTAFLRGATEAFLPLEAGPYPTSYTSAAVVSAVLGLNEQFTAVPAP